MSRFDVKFALLGLAVTLAAPALAENTSSKPATNNSRNTADFVPPSDIEQCAEIEQGVRRLQCYDHFLQPSSLDEDQEGLDPDLKDVAESLGMDGEDLEKTQKRAKPTLVEQLLSRQRALFSYSGAFVRHRPNFLLPITYVDDNNSAPKSVPFGRQSIPEDLDNLEAKFQFSVRMPVLTGLFPDRTSLWVAYTQLSFWQGYNRDESSPFRETNYEPEVFFSYEPRLRIGPGSFDILSIGFNHQSNGRSDPFSRSWNRILANIVYSNDRWVFSASPWYRIPEDTDEDNNPDIHKYLGYGDYNFTYKLAEDTTLGVLFRNNLDFDENRSTFRLDYTFALSDSLSAYVQYYHGWGESLIDYNHHVKRIGVGITLADWL